MKNHNHGVFVISRYHDIVKSLKKFNKSLLALAFAAFLTGAAQPSYAFLATEFTQVLNNIELVQQYAQQVQQYQTQMQQYATQLQQAAQSPSFAWSNTAQTLQNLGQVVQQGQAMAYNLANLDQQFRQVYPGYVAPQNYAQSYQQWSQTSLDSIRGAMNAAGMQAQNFSSENALIGRLQQNSQTAAGRMQAIQAGNQIALEGVQQTRLLRQLIMSQMQAQNAYMASQQQDQAARQAMVQSSLNQGASSIPSGTTGGIDPSSFKINY